MRFYVASQRVVPCLYVLVRSDSKRYKPAQHTTTGWRTYKDCTTINYGPINYTCCKDLSVNAFFHVRATHLTRQVGSLPLAKNAKHSSSMFGKRWFAIASFPGSPFAHYVQKVHMTFESRKQIPRESLVHLGM